MKRSLKDRIALVTGGSRGIGPYIARALARQGAHVVIVARSKAGELEAVAASLRALGVKCVALRADLSSSDDRAQLVERAASELGPIDILVNNAGLESEGAFVDIDAETITRTIEVNLTAPLLLAREALPGMIERGFGHVVTLSSLAGKKGAPYDAVYSGTKAALVEWTEALRCELYGTGVDASVVCPGYVRGEGMFARFGIAPPGFLGSCTPEQVANAVVRAVTHNIGQQLVNSRPVAPLLALYSLWPNMGAPVMRWIGLAEFQRRKVRLLAGPSPAPSLPARSDETVG
jgi:short-subunit dehydrogenase